MVHFHKLINYLSKEQRCIASNLIEIKPTSDPSTRLQMRIKSLYQPLCGQDNHFELISSNDNFSIINSLLNLLTVYPTNYEYLKNNLKAYLTNYVIIYGSVLRDYKLNTTKLNYYLDSELDHEDLLLLAALAFQVNIVVIMENKCSVYSPVNLDRFYMVVYQDNNFKYHAVKYQPGRHNGWTFILHSLNLLEPDHPLIKKILQKVIVDKSI